MLLDGVNHMALLTKDAARLHAFYREIFDAEEVIEYPQNEDGFELTLLKIGERAELNIFQIAGNSEVERPPNLAFGRGRIDHFGLQAASREAFDEVRRRLMACGASDGFVTDFGPVLSVFFRDPDGLECEVCIDNPDAVPGVVNPPGTPAQGYEIP